MNYIFRNLWTKRPEGSLYVKRNTKNLITRTIKSFMRNGAQ